MKNYDVYDRLKQSERNVFSDGSDMKGALSTMRVEQDRPSMSIGEMFRHFGQLVLLVLSVYLVAAMLCVLAFQSGKSDFVPGWATPVAKLINLVLQ